MSPPTTANGTFHPPASAPKLFKYLRRRERKLNQSWSAMQLASSKLYQMMRIYRPTDRPTHKFSLKYQLPSVVAPHDVQQVKLIPICKCQRDERTINEQIYRWENFYLSRRCVCEAADGHALNSHLLVTVQRSTKLSNLRQL